MITRAKFWNLHAPSTLGNEKSQVLSHTWVLCVFRTRRRTYIARKEKLALFPTENYGNPEKSPKSAIKEVRPPNGKISGELVRPKPEI